MAKETLLIIDYGSGNLRSVAKAFEYKAHEDHIDCDVIVSDRPEDIRKADRVVLPGQGAFGDCKDNLERSGLIAPLEEAVLKKSVPFLGICVGMQLLATRGVEHGVYAGLNWIPGQVIPIVQTTPSLKIPHMGWNEVVMAHYEGASPEQDNAHFVLRSAESSNGEAKHYYFVHSYMFQCEYDHHILGMSEYGQSVTAIVGRDNILGVQFHPEKSASAGLELLSGFMKWRP
ncbi:MAG: imidazole glycerol phosphate synthase subunit HisH [Micavibrio sp.]|nr:imidazole glycerol phosphate synthase subunit HisH [Micavibrio sp.]